jgi:hypothetical protein
MGKTSMSRFELPIGATPIEVRLHNAKTPAGLSFRQSLGQEIRPSMYKIALSPFVDPVVIVSDW